MPGARRAGARDGGTRHGGRGEGQCGGTRAGPARRRLHGVRHGPVDRARGRGRRGLRGGAASASASRRPHGPPAQAERAECTAATAPDTPAPATATVTATLATSAVAAKPPADAAPPPATAPPSDATPPAAAAAEPPPPDRPAAARTAPLRPAVGRTGSSDREAVALLGDREPVGVAGRALAHVAAQRSPPQHAAARHGELLADGLARQRARVALGDQRRPRLEDERLDLRRRAPEHARDLRLARPAQLEQDERLALLVGQAREVAHQLPQVGAARDVLGEAVEAGLVVLGRGGGLAPRRQRRQAAVAGDREQPRPHRVRRRLVAQRAVRPQEGLLEHVLGVVEAAEHVAAEGQQRRVVAFVDRLERTLVALAHERGEP